jgi:competence protein ComEA
MKCLRRWATYLAVFSTFTFFSQELTWAAEQERAKKVGEQKAAGAEQHKVDLNRASQAELETIPGVGPDIASRIIGARPFRKVEELKSISGIGDSRFAEIREHVKVSGQGAASAKAGGEAVGGRDGKEKTAAAHPGRSEKIDLNSASAEILQTLPGVGPAVAQEIIAARPFKSVGDLKNVKGIGEARLRDIRPLVTVREATRPASGAPAQSAKGTSASQFEKKIEIERPGAASREAKVNINTASQEELESLLEIGPVKAQAIIDNRPYKSIDDVMNVKGIKEGTFDAIKDRITVR